MTDREYYVTGGLMRNLLRCVAVLMLALCVADAGAGRKETGRVEIKTNASTLEADINVVPTSLTIIQSASQQATKPFAITAFDSTVHTKAIDESYVVRRFYDQSQQEVVVINVPGKPPESHREQTAFVTASAVTLTQVPAFDWSFGCSATSAAMIAGYYDNSGFPNMYSGPTNGGIMPMNNSSWGSATINGELRKQCPLSATRMGVDGRATRGHVDDYWIVYGNAGPDPWIVNGWPEHTYGDCTGDYMKTNQSARSNSDGSTRYYYYSNGNPYSGTASDDGCYGLRLFFESRGYTVTSYFTQTIYGYNSNTLGFTFAQFMQEINAGRPVMIQIQGHSMVGYGYDEATSTVYIHDTWDYSNHSMLWGGSYSGMQQWGVGVYQLAPAAVTNTFAIQNLGSTTLNLTSVTDDKAWLTTSPAVPPQVDVAAGGSQTISVSVDWAQVPGNQDVGTVTIGSNDPDEATVEMTVTAIKAAQSVTVTSPNGGESWEAATTHNITWTSNGITNVKIDYTTNNGTSWLPVTASAAASGGSYPWMIPGTASTQCKVRVQDAADGSPSDESNAVFTIATTRFQVNMRIKMRQGAFLPGAGDVVVVRGSFNSWAVTDTLKDEDHDSIYTKTIAIQPGLITYKFWKSLRFTQAWEDIVNPANPPNGDRQFTVVSGSQQIPVVYFNNESLDVPLSFVHATFNVNMGTYIGAGILIPRRTRFLHEAVSMSSFSAIR